MLEEIDEFERLFGSIPRLNKDGVPVAFAGTIRRGEGVIEAAEMGETYIQPGDEDLVDLAMSEKVYPDDMIQLAPDEDWVLPRGAYKHSGGPT